ncbi:LrgB family protein [Priestia flexa]|uniref:LrgB family protein n=1 Tax=Priestia flexa TaxID=86664 RepID=UPI00099CD3A6|nr:LrgB family protein [Priestia flexa]AQX56633.1 hypothetical protein BC359_20725 [Priestia flexa]
MSDTFVAIFIISLTIVIYLCMNRLYLYLSSPFFFPVLTATVLIVFLLVNFHISYNTYMVGGRLINYLLGPAVVSLAYPLYNHRYTLKKSVWPILVGTITGLISGMVSGFIFAKIFDIERILILSIIPKSITAPVAIEITAELGGIPSMTVLFVIIAGLTGVIFGPFILKLFRINTPLSKGISLGSASHVLGISKASEYGEISLCMGSVSMTLSAVLGSIIGPFMAWLLHI